MRQLIENWDGLAVVSRFHRPTASWIFVLLHDDALGAPAGGTRMKVYPSPEDGLLDGMRLAEGMTLKWAAIELGFGGGKAVIALSRELAPPERDEVLGVYGRLLASLRGAFSTGQDLGTTAEDMGFLRRIAPYVHGPDPATGRVLDPGPYTARGVLAGIRASVAHVLGSRDLSGLRVLVQGVGGVGRPLARLCAGAGARVLVADLDRERARRVAHESGGEVVEAKDAASTPCDVYAPCAVGATLNRDTVADLACHVVAGSANNQLAEPEDAGRLHEREILYAPDYVINAGGALAFGLKSTGEKDEGVIGARLDGLEAALSEIFAEAAASGESPVLAARRHAERVLARARGRA